MTGESLANFDDLEVGKSCSLLAGNGLSLAVSTRFKLCELCDELRTRVANDELCSPYADVLGQHGSGSVEDVLGYLTFSAQLIASKHGSTVTPYFDEAALCLRQAFFGSLHEFHPARLEIKNRLATLSNGFQLYSEVFTLSFDLLIPWMRYDTGQGGSLEDMFFMRDLQGKLRYGGVENIFPKKQCSPLWYLHGAMHLGVDTTGVFKRAATDFRNLEGPVDEAVLGGSLLVLEGTAQRKSVCIAESEYLAEGLSRLTKGAGDIVVLGCKLAQQDQHIVTALAARPTGRVLIGVHRPSSPEWRGYAVSLTDRMGAKDVLFFDATTHPLIAALADGAPA